MSCDDTGLVHTSAWQGKWTSATPPRKREGQFVSRPLTRRWLEHVLASGSVGLDAQGPANPRLLSRQSGAPGRDGLTRTVPGEPHTSHRPPGAGLEDTLGARPSALDGIHCRQRPPSDSPATRAPRPLAQWPLTVLVTAIRFQSSRVVPGDGIAPQT